MINFPSNPSTNDTVVLAGKTYKFDGTAWKVIPATIHNDASGIQGGITNERYHLTAEQYAALGGAPVTISQTAPLTPAAGDLWFDSVNGILAIYYNDGTSSQWVDATNGLSVNPSLITTPVTVTYNASATTTIVLDGVTEHFKATAATGPTTWAISGTPSGQSTGFILDLTNGGSQTQTWPAGTLYDGGIAPSGLTAAGKDRFIFQYDGVAWSMFVVSKDIK